MEMNRSDIIDHSVDLVWSTGDEGDGQGNKLYACTFCKRGFSNAQALGGHMNIHRRDRARLKESSEETLVLVEKCLEETSAQQQESRREDEKSSTLKRLWLFPEEGDDCASPRKKDALGGDVVQLPLFVEMPSTSNSISIDGPSNIRDVKNEGNRVSSSSSSTKDELDLELRLGVDS